MYMHQRVKVYLFLFFEYDLHVLRGVVAAAHTSEMVYITSLCVGHDVVLKIQC
jgi:hypothetical protein